MSVLLPLRHQVAEVLSIGNDEYHRTHPAISNSAKECFRESRETFKAQFIDRTLPWPEPTDDMILGTHCHTALLEPEVFANRATPKPVIIEPELAPDGKKWYCRKGSDHFKWWADFEADRDRQLADWRAENVGKYQISDKHLAIALEVCKAAHANKIIRTILDETSPENREHTIRWQCQYTGLDLKSRRDLNHPQLIGDFKTIGITLSAATVARRIANLGYIRQADFYTMGEQVFSGQEKPFVFIFLSTKPPFTVGLFDLDEDDLKFAHKQNMETLAAMKHCQEHPEYYTPEHVSSIYTLTLPKWTRYDDEYGF
jgi:hypothetical protein